MTPEEDKEYAILSEKRDSNALTNKEYKRYKVLVNMAFNEGLPKIAAVWADGFGL